MERLAWSARRTAVIVPVTPLMSATTVFGVVPALMYDVTEKRMSASTAYIGKVDKVCIPREGREDSAGKNVK